MPILATSRQNTKVRAIAEADTPGIFRMLNTAWRVYVRNSPLELSSRLKNLPGFLAEDKVGLRGFMAFEPHPPNMAFLIAAGLRDTWNIKPWLDLLLPQVEEAAQAQKLSKLVYLGNADWLIDDLQHRGFNVREWIISLERLGTKISPPPPTPAVLRPANPDDLQALKTLDSLAFEEVWHRAIGDIDDALVKGTTFVLAELDGKIVGFEWCEIYRQRAHLSRLAVHPRYQRHGIGAQLLHRAISEALAQGVNHITLNTQEDNYRSLALYQRFGFVITKQRMPLLLKELG